jgi:hypothetical protein
MAMGMMRLGKWLGILALAAASALLLVRKGLDRDGNRDISTGQTGSVQELREEVTHLKGELQKLGRISGTAISAAVSAQAGVAKLENSDKRIPAHANDVPGGNAPQLPEEVLLRGTEQRFQQEAQDSNWSADAEAVARRHLSHGLTGQSNVRQVACRSTICKALVVHESQAVFLQAQNEMMTHPSTDWKGQLAFSETRERPDGRVELDTYLFREGANPLGEIAEEEHARLASNH